MVQGQGKTGIVKKTERFTVQSMGPRQVKSPRVNIVHIGLYVLGQGHHGDSCCTKRRCLGSEHLPHDIWPIVAGHEPGHGLIVRCTWAGELAWVQELVV